MKQRTEANSIGRDSELVFFEEPSAPVRDHEGGYSEGWTPLNPPTWYVRVRAATVRDQESVIAGTVVTHLTVMVHGRYHPGVTTKTRMTFKGQVYQVTSVVNVDGQDTEMNLTADLQG